MKLNIIIPLYNPSESIKTIISNLIEQKSQDFRINLIIDNPSSENLEEINDIRYLFPENSLSITINSKHQSINKVIYEALLDSKEPYSFIYYPDLEINSYWVLNVLKTLTNKKVDILETRALYRGYIKHDEKIKPLEKRVYDLSQEQEPFVFTSSVIFNKVFKTELLKNVLQNWKNIKSSNKEYSIDVNFATLLKANTYYYDGEIETISWNYTTQSLNVKSLKSEWKILQSLFEEKLSNLELWEYCKFYNYQIFIAGYLGYIKYWKMKLLGKNLNLKGIKTQLIEQLSVIYSNIEEFKNNKYLILSNLHAVVDDKFINEENWNDIFYKFV